jgi:hypothetical protein
LEQLGVIDQTNHEEISNGVFMWLTNMSKVIGERKPKFEKRGVAILKPTIS